MSQLDPELEQHSLALQAKIRERIAQHNDISFAEFMQMALYEPGLGYYAAGIHKFGKGGDFITAPELGDLFARCLAQQFQQLMQTLVTPVILELGAGTGQFCYDCLLELERLDALPEKYYVLEVSADLQQRQQQKIKTLPLHLQKLVSWIQQPLTDEFSGIVFANEVLDALAVEVFKYENCQFKQMRIKYVDGFKLGWSEFPKHLQTEILQKNLSLEDGYVSEFVPNLSTWLQAISASLTKGMIFFIDYGYDSKAYYHSQRKQGTLVCHFQHKANFDYFANIGIQDITAFVDFTAVAQAADDCGLSVYGYTTLAHFLMALEVHNKLGDPQQDYVDYYQKATEMKKLTMPNEMGERFKVIALSKGLVKEVAGFSFSNQLHLL